MSTTAFPGPLSIEGGKPLQLGPTPPTPGGQAAIGPGDRNPDLAPSLFWGGMGIRDPRWLQRIGAGALVAGGYAYQDVGWYMTAGGLVVVDQVPATLGTAKIAPAAAVASGVAMTLATASTGITVLSSALSLFVPLGATIPAGALVIDANPAYVGGGTSGGFQFLDPSKGVARAVSITAAAGATGGAFTVRGYDWYGAALTETITAVASSTVNGKKAFKFVTSVTPAVTDAGHTYSVGTTDIFGFHVLAQRFGYTSVLWDDTNISANTGFVAGVTTTATATTGDVRGTYATQSASDSTKRLMMFVSPSVANIVVSSVATATTNLIGVTQYSA